MPRVRGRLCPSGKGRLIPPARADTHDAGCGRLQPGLRLANDPSLAAPAVECFGNPSPERDERGYAMKSGNGQRAVFPVLFILLPILFGWGSATGQTPAQTKAQIWGPSARFIASADVLDLGWGKFAIREYLDVYNDDFRRPLTVTDVKADVWVGHRPSRLGDNWFSGHQPVLIPPSEVRRVVERHRIVIGRPKPNWWVRWVKFKVTTDRGEYQSNFVSAPLRPPGVPRAQKEIGEFDSLSAPGIFRGDLSR